MLIFGLGAWGSSVSNVEFARSSVSGSVGKPKGLRS